MNKKDPSFARSWATPESISKYLGWPGQAGSGLLGILSFCFCFFFGTSLRECELWNTLQSNNFLLLRFKIAIIIVNNKLKEVVGWFVSNKLKERDVLFCIHLLCELHCAGAVLPFMARKVRFGIHSFYFYINLVHIILTIYILVMKFYFPCILIPRCWEMREKDFDYVIILK